jgi:hypothetical protein
MNHQELVELIGEPVGSIIITGRYGNATLHRHGYWSCDPCYLHFKDESGVELGDKIKAAYHAKFPWEGYDYEMHHNRWAEFEFNGQTLFARDCGDGVGYFGNSVDAGWVVVMPLAIAPTEMNQHAIEAHK